MTTESTTPEITPNAEAAAASMPTLRFRRTRKWAKRGLLGGVVVGAALFGASCVHLHADNPAFPATTAEINAARAHMEANPVGLSRPVIVLSGYRSPPGSSAALASKIRKLTGAEKGQVRYLSYMWSDTVEGPARKAVEFVEEHWPSDDPDWTAEVDVVAISMGGLVARTAAAGPELYAKEGESRETGVGGKRLRIHTLYTLASPHRGAILADTVAVDPASRSMVAGSDFMQRLDAAWTDSLDRAPEEGRYEIVPYAVLRDRWVGATRSAPIGAEPVWVPGRLIFSHHLIGLDRRIQTDLARRLRDEAPLGEPGEPPHD